MPLDWNKFKNEFENELKSIQANANEFTGDSQMDDILYEELPKHKMELMELYIKACKEKRVKPNINLQRLLDKLDPESVDDQLEDVICYNLAADLGYPQEKYNLGIYYEQGLLGLKKNLEMALRYYGEAAKQGFAQAQYHLGVCYEQGLLGLKKNLEMARKHYKAAAKQGFAQAQCNLGVYYEKGLCGLEKNLELALTYCKAAEEQGFAPAQYNLGVYYEKGLCGLKKNSKLAAQLYRKAAKQGLLVAKYNLAFCYEYGIGVKKDLELALRYYEEAAKQGLVQAQHHLGVCYEQGLLGLKENSELALSYYEAAAEQGFAQAQHHLGVCYEQGLLGLKKNLEMARKHYKAAAKQGFAPAQYDLGVCYEQGLLGLKKNLEMARKHYKAAAKQGFAPAQYDLGVCYEQGLLGLKENSELALSYYEAAAEQGFEQAQYYLGVCYKQGLLGLEKNLEMARKHYEAAAVQGYAKAIEALSNLNNYSDLETELETDLETESETELETESENPLNPPIAAQVSSVNVVAHSTTSLSPGSAETTLQRLSARNLELAPGHYIVATNKSFAQAQHDLAVCYERGLFGLEENSELALGHYIIAANEDFTPAQYYLGVCYKQGLLGLEKNLEMARKHYEAAAVQGYAKAIEALSNLNNYSDLETESETESETELETESETESENPLNPPIAAQVSPVNVVVAYSTTALSPGLAETTLQQLSIQMQNLEARLGIVENCMAPQILMQNLEARVGRLENYIAPQILFDNIKRKILDQSTNQREYITTFKSTCSQIYTKYLMAMSGVSGRKGDIITILLKALKLIPAFSVAGEAMLSAYNMLNARELKINASKFFKLVPTSTELDELARRLAIFMALHHKGLNDLPQRPNRLKSIIDGISYSEAEQLAITDAIKMMASVLAAQEEVSSLEVLESFMLQKITYTEEEKAKYGVEEPTKEEVLEYVRDPNKFIALCYNTITQESANPVKIEVDNWCNLPAHEGSEVKVRLSYSTVSSVPETAKKYYNQIPSSSLGLG
jgi:TPR repeat protein